MPPLLLDSVRRAPDSEDREDVSYYTRSGREVRQPVRFAETNDSRTDDSHHRMDSPADRSSSPLHDPPSSAETTFSSELYNALLPDNNTEGPRRRRRRRLEEPEDDARIEQRHQRHRRLSHGSSKQFLISPEHPMKVLWDVLTVVISLVNAYLTHQSIRDRTFIDSPFLRFSEGWFVVDILLNFITIQRRDGFTYDTFQSVWARYLTTWFVFDVLSLVPGEYMYVKPLFEKQKARNLVVKTFFRSKAVVKVSRVLRGRHVRLFGSVARRTKHAGVGANRLLRLIIKYAPKYILFIRNMRAVILCRLLRQVHWCRKLWRGLLGKSEDDSLKDSITDEDDWEDDLVDDDDSVRVVLYNVYNEMDDPF